MVPSNALSDRGSRPPDEGETWGLETQPKFALQIAAIAFQIVD